jgi:hypothetical protein
MKLAGLVFPLIPEPNLLRFIWDTAASNQPGGSREEEAFHGRADRLRLDVGVEGPDDRGDLPEARRV